MDIDVIKREATLAIGLVILLLGSMTIATGSYPPMVVVESGSMMHDPENGSVTAANSSPISDGASMLILMSEKKANELNINPIAEIVGYNDSATSPDLFTIAPAKSVENLLYKTTPFCASP